MKKIGLCLAGLVFPLIACEAAEPGSVKTVDCPKCTRRIRIAEDGGTAYVNLSRVAPDELPAVKTRAEAFLRRARPVTADDRRCPLMGWSSWNTFGVDISEEIILGVAKAMATNGLARAGYVYVNIDDGFFNGHGPDGRLRFHPQRFPRGMKGTVDGIHALGLKAGIYSDAGSDTCGSIWSNDPLGRGAGLYGHDAADCRLHFNELGFDFIKVDYCGAKALGLDERRRYTEIADAIRATGRKDVRFNVCRWAFPGTWVTAIAESWRVTYDIRANWDHIRRFVKENMYLSAYASPGHFNDMDMLEVGQLKGKVKSTFGKEDCGLTRDEEITHFGMWCMMSSPLLIGCDVRTIDSNTLALITNPFLIRMNQDPLGKQAYVVQREGEAYVFVKDADVPFGRSRYVALYNAGDVDHEFTVRAETLDLAGRTEVFDLVDRSDPGGFEGSFTLKVGPHCARFFRFDGAVRLERSVYEAEDAWLSEYSELKGHGEPVGICPDAMPGASGGMVVRKLGGSATNDLVWKDVNIVKPGVRELVFRCASKEANRLFVQIDGGNVTDLGGVPANGVLTDLSFSRELSSGTHVVRLFNADGKAPAVDVLRIR